MRTTDIISLSFQSLWQHKVRMVLTLLGVIAGAFLIMISLSIGEGVQTRVLRRFQMGDRLRLIRVYPGRVSAEDRIPPEKLKITGEMSDDKRERIRQAIIEHWNFNNYQPSVPLTSARLDEIAAIPHVESVIPDIVISCRAVLADKTEFSYFRGVDFTDPTLQNLIIEGETPDADAPRSVVIHEFLAYRWGHKTDEEVRQLIGKTIQVESRGGGSGLQWAMNSRSGKRPEITPDESRILDALALKLPVLLKSLGLSSKELAVLNKIFPKNKPRKRKDKSPPQSHLRKPHIEKFLIVGVFRDPTKEEKKESVRSRRGFGLDILMPVKKARKLAVDSSFQSDNSRGFYQATILVDENVHVQDVVEKIEGMKLQQSSLAGIVERIQQHIALITYSMAFLAGVALMVAGLGIANTMVMSVMERTHEIGVMKAIGARSGHVQLIFLLEGTLIGLIGGVLGTILGWAASIPGDSFVKNTFEAEFRSQDSGSLFAFPLWLILGVPLFSMLVTMLASVYPARRAAHINPIEALRHD
jgi:putative ABC transport system permease protein